MNTIKRKEKAGVATETVELGIRCIIREELVFDREFWVNGRFRLPAGSTAFESEKLQIFLMKELTFVKQNILEFLPKFFGHKEIFFLDCFFEHDTDNMDLEVSLDPVQCMIPDNFDFAKIDRMLSAALSSITIKIGLERTFKNTKTQRGDSDE